jgi:hypothetical protein
MISSAISAALLLLAPTAAYRVPLRAQCPRAAAASGAYRFALRAQHLRAAASASPLELTQPTQAECESMGVRDWPDTVVREKLEEACSAGALRYVLEGTGTLSCGDESISVAPNSLVKVCADEGATLCWMPDSELVLLTPEYRGPPLLPIVGGFFFACVLLVAATAAGQ